MGFEEDLENLILKHEGIVTYAYRDSLGYCTIGVGRLIDKRKGGGISKDEALYLLRNDIASNIEKLNVYIPWWRTLTNNRQMVLVDMCFNLGINGLLDFKKTLSALKDGNYEEAIKEMIDSEWYTQVGQRGKDLVKMIREG